MPVTQNAPNHLVLQAGSTTLTLDKDADQAVLQRKILFWRLKPSEVSSLKSQMLALIWL